MNRLQAQAAALSVAAISMLLVVIVALNSSEGPGRLPDAPPPETAEQKAAREAARPRPTPDRIILNWKGDPTTSQAVTWRTDTSITRAGAQIALADPGPGVESGWNGYDLKKIGTFTARTEPFKSGLNEANYHSVNFEGLKPATRYMYRAGDGIAWSEWFQFETAALTPEPFGFIYFGDAQNGIKSLWSRVSRGAYSEMPKARFIIHAGDLVNDGMSDAQWGEWHTAAGWINGSVPSVPTPGNHEFPSKLTPFWRPQFTLPENGPAGLEETCYFFDFQGARIISLNSNERITDQVPWLEQKLESRPSGIHWTVVTFHHPLYATSPGRDNKVLRQAWRPILDKYNVDLVLQGHDHGYGRSGLMRDDVLLSGDPLRGGKGTIYAVSVSGTKMYTLDKLAWAKRSAANLQLYQLIRIDGNVLKYESRTARGDLFDAFELRKRPDGSKVLIELPVPPPPSPDPTSWAMSTPFEPRPTETAATKPTSTTLEGNSGYGRGLVAGVILGTIVLGLIAAIRGAGRKPRPAA